MAKDEEEYREEWKDGNSVRRSFYRFGQWKLLELNGIPRVNMDEVTATVWNYDNLDIPNLIGYRMTLVAKGVDPLEGENGYAPTTWLATQLTSASTFPETSIGSAYWFSIKDDNGSRRRFDWSVGYMRKFLQGQFTSIMFPQDLKNYLRRVIKYTHIGMVNPVSSGGDPYNYMDYPTIDWIWLPSIREIFSTITDIDDVLKWYSNITSGYESIGPVYDSVFPGGDTMNNTKSQRASINCTFPTRSCYNPEVKYSDQSASGAWLNNIDGTIARSAPSYPKIIFGFCL